MSLEAKVELLTTAVLALVSAVQQANGTPLKPIIGADPNVKTPAAATPATPAAAASPAVEKPKLNKDGETEQYTKEVKPVLMSFVKSHGREFVLGHLAKAGFDATGLTPIKGGERKAGEYAATIAHMQAGMKEASPTQSLG